MTIPDYQAFMLPLLKVASDGEIHKFIDVLDLMADQAKVSDEDRKIMLPSGNVTLFRSRVHWAKTYMKQAGLLEFPKRGLFRITPRGLEVLKSNPKKVNNSVLQQFEEFRDFKKRSRKKEQKTSTPLEKTIESPEDQMASAFSRYQSEIENELLATVRQVSASFFEQLVVDLLVGMGYGGNRQDAGKAVGKVADGGIDGVIKEDRLGLDVIYIQAKRWENTVGRPDVQKFAGALQGKRARKGVLITTSNFSREAHDFARSIDSKIILVDGDELARLMIEFEIGVSTVGLYRLKQIDSDYFDQ